MTGSSTINTPALRAPKTERTSSLAMDHPGWFRSHTLARRAFRSPAGTWVVVCRQHGANLEPKLVPIGSDPVTESLPIADRFDTRPLPPLLRAAKPFKHFDQIVRFRNPDLWDALLRRIIKTSQAHRDAYHSYRRLCLNHGTVLQTPDGVTVLPPTPEQVLSIPRQAFHEMRIEWKVDSIRSVAEAVLHRATGLMNVERHQLVHILHSIPEVGFRIARHAAADMTNDFSLLPLAEIMTHGLSTHLLSRKKCDLTASEIRDELVSPTHRATFAALLLAMEHTVTQAGGGRWADVSSVNPEQI